MKRPLLPTLLAFTLQLYADGTYLLPHRWQDARHELTAVIRSAPSRITIVTDELDDSIIRRTLRDAIKAHKQITLMTVSKRTAGAWALYQSVDACILAASKPLGFSLIATDAPESCSVTLPLSTEALRNRYGVVRCTSTNDFNETISYLKKDCRAYLQP
jgi:hypothetical protein